MFPGPLFCKLINGLIEFFTISGKKEGEFYFFPSIENIRFPNILIIPPSIAEPQFPINKIIDSPHPIPHDNRFSPKIVL